MRQGQRTDVERYSTCERFRRSRDWSQVRLAGIAGVGIAVVAAIEKGRVARLRLETLVRVGRALGCSVVDLVPGLAVRESAGGRVQRSGGEMRSSGRAKRQLVRREIVAMLERSGGRAVMCDVTAELREKFGVLESYTRSVRHELGAEGKVGCERIIGRGRSPRAWEWYLPAREAQPELPLH